jgi:hypothetical protein
MAEHWRPIPGYEGIYDISNLAGVRTWFRKGQMGRRVPTDRPVPIHPMRCFKRNKNVYELVVNLTDKDGNRKRYMMKHLMRDIWMEGVKPGLEVRCKDGDQTNCSLYNLCYTTHKQICASKQKRKGNRVPIKKLDAKTKEVVDFYSSITEAAKKNYLSERAITLRIQNKTVIDGVLFKRDR